MDITEGALNGEMIVADAAGQEFLAGSVARQVLPQGVPIARSAVVQPGDRGFLAAVLPKGMRAITIPDRRGRRPERPGASRRPGRPDPDLSVAGDDGTVIRASETVISNLRVLAFDQRLGPEAPPKDKEGKAEGAPGRPDRDPRGLVAPGGDDHAGADAGHPVAGPQLGARRRRRGRDGQARQDRCGEPRQFGARLRQGLRGAARTAPDAASPTSPRRNKVQIVRGVSIRATATAAEAPAAEAGPATCRIAPHRRE